MSLFCTVTFRANPSHNLTRSPSHIFSDFILAFTIRIASEGSLGITLGIDPFDMGVIVTAPPSAAGAICRDAQGTPHAVRIGDRLARIATHAPLPSFRLDAHGTGQIGASELRRAFEKLGGNALTEEEALDVIAAYDPDCNGYMDVDEFEDLAREAMLQNVTETVSAMVRPFELHFSRQLMPSSAGSGSGVGSGGVGGAAGGESDSSARIRRASKKNVLETLGEDGEETLRGALFTSFVDSLFFCLLIYSFVCSSIQVPLSTTSTPSTRRAASSWTLTCCFSARAWSPTRVPRATRWAKQPRARAVLSRTTATPLRHRQRRRAASLRGQHQARLSRSQSSRRGRFGPFRCSAPQS